MWENVCTWWAIRDAQCVPVALFRNETRYARGDAAHRQVLNIRVDEQRWEQIVEYCSFDWMKAHATKSAPFRGAFWDAGADVFINQGVNGRWRDTLTEQEVKEYEARAVAELGRDCALWLATGEGRG